MRKGELHSERGISVVLLLFLLGGALLLSVPAVKDASLNLQMSDTAKDTMSEPILREHRERSWDFLNIRPLSYSPLSPSDFEKKSSVESWELGSPPDLVPFGTPHAPIIIGNNSDFEDQSWPGEGTVEQPYIIAGLEINATTGESAINITNTDVHFFIKDCWLTSNETSVIELNSVSYGNIINNTILASDRGVVALHSENLTINDNLFFSFSWSGIYIEDCSYSFVRNNNCTMCFVGIHVEQSNTIFVEDNFCTDCFEGIELYLGCEYSTIYNNTIQDSWDGIYVYLNCHDNLIDSNNCTQIEHIAIVVIECSENTILNNFCYQNVAGILLLNCTTHTITGNDCWFYLSVQYEPQYYYIQSCQEFNFEHRDG
jgi:parallel beta-helix repeat protein